MCQGFLWAVWTRLTPTSPLSPYPHSHSLWPQVKANWRLTCCLSLFPCLTEMGCLETGKSCTGMYPAETRMRPWKSKGEKGPEGEFQWEFCIRGLIKINCVWMRENNIGVTCVGGVPWICTFLKYCSQSYSDRNITLNPEDFTVPPENYKPSLPEVHQIHN